MCPPFESGFERMVTDKRARPSSYQREGTNTFARSMKST